VAARYQILDEPNPGALASVAVNPMWPLLGAMLGGLWLAVPWFIVNAFAMGSPTRGREVALALTTLAGSFAVAFGLIVFAGTLDLSKEQIRYLVIVPTLWKIGMAYALYVVQRRTFALFEYYGGNVRSPLVVLIVATLVRPQLLASIKSFVVAYVALA
jgi:hypothetical protein